MTDKIMPPRYDNPREVGMWRQLVSNLLYSLGVEMDLTAKYKISDIATGTPAYYGFVDADGGWYIMEENAGAYRYIKGDSGYAAAWAGRAALSYTTYDVIF